LRRNIYRNAGLVQVDASLMKNNHLPWIGEQGNLQFRFDFINLFNHTNLGPVDANMADGVSAACIPSSPHDNCGWASGCRSSRAEGEILRRAGLTLARLLSRDQVCM
jgi:hypothetical protein